MLKHIIKLCSFTTAVTLLCALSPGTNGAFASTANPESPGILTCWVSILPQKYFAERIGGDHVTVEVMVGSGQSPATYEPTGRQLAGLAESQLYFSIGVAFEQSLLHRIERSFENVDLVDSSNGIPRRKMMGHTHGENSEHDDHGENDPHIWLSPRYAIRIADNIRQALCDRDPDRANIYSNNFELLKIDIIEADRLASDVLATHAGQEVFVFHPAYGYFTDEYGLVQIPIEVAGGTPGPKHLAEIIDHAKAESVTTIFVQPQFSPTSAKTIAKTVGAVIETLDPLAEDYTGNLVDMAMKMAAALPTRTAKE